MSYFLVNHPLQLDSEALIEGAEVQHLLARRIKVGEVVELQDPAGDRFSCRVTRVAKKEVSCKVLTKSAVPAEYTTQIILYQALIAEQALDAAIQKTTELGVNIITVFKSHYSPNILQSAKLHRWQRISNEAAKQCGRRTPARVTIGEFANLIKEIPASDSFYLSQNAFTTNLDTQSKLSSAGTIHLFVGPEGGWSEAEINAFSKAGIFPLRLSRFTLRAETAAISALAQLALFVR